MTRTRPAPVLRPLVVVLGVLGLAANLRAALAGYPPLLQTVRADLGISAGAAGLVQTSALLMMAVASFTAPRLALRTGRERATALAVGVLAAGSLVRGVPSLAALVAGSLLVGLGIGWAGVLLTGVVKDHLAARAGAVSGGYVVSMLVGAVAASALAVPLAVTLGGWSLSLAVWAVPAVIAAAAWVPVARRVPRPGPAAVAEPLAWRSRFGWLAAGYMIATSMQWYGWLTWLAPYYESQGAGRQGAALILAVWNLAQIPTALAVPALAERRQRFVLGAGVPALAVAAAGVGALVVPVLPGVGPWVWVLLMALGLGAGFPIGLAVIAWRTPDGAASAAVSGLALGVGYVAAALSPLLIGVLIDGTGSYAVALTVPLAAVALQGVMIVLIGDGPGRVRSR